MTAPRDPAWLAQAQDCFDKHVRYSSHTGYREAVCEAFATLLATVDTAAREKCGDQLVEMQRHRDAWRGYAYGRRERPRDYLDGDMLADDQGLSIEERITAAEARGREAERAEASRYERIGRLYAELWELGCPWPVSRWTCDEHKVVGCLDCRTEKR